MRTIFVVAGEVSGDTHGAGLVRALQESHGPLRVMGLGGPQLRDVGGAQVTDWLDRAGVLGLWEVLKEYGWFRKMFAAALQTIAREAPDLVILVDYPGFNLRLAKALRRQGFRGRIVFYISPQVWAWKSGRIKTMARVLDLMICIFPFEKDLYESSGLRTVFAGHPLVDRMAHQRRSWEREKSLVAFFPGSRTQEVARLFPVMLRAAALIRQKVPQARFAASAASEPLRSRMLEIISREGNDEARQWIEVGSASDLMQRAEVGVVASGTATLEAACLGLPYVLVYKVNPLTYAVGRALVHVHHLGIINILAGETVVDELVQGECEPEPVAAAVTALLLDETKRDGLKARLRTVVALLGDGNAYQRAADAVIAEFPEKTP